MNKINVLIAIIAILGTQMGHAGRLPNRLNFKPGTFIKETAVAIQAQDDNGYLVRFVKPMGANCYHAILDTIASRQAGNDDSFWATTSGGLDVYTVNGIRYRYYNVAIAYCKKVQE